MQKIVKKQDNYKIQVCDVYKTFNLIFDKPHTLKERFIKSKIRKKQTFEALKNININITEGEMIAIIGNNGSGKSTLLKLISKIIYPSKGKIITSGKVTSLLELGAGFHADFTGRENIYFNASIFGLTKKEIDKRINDIIEFSELNEFIDLPVRTYSSGMYMRLAFSIAIHVDAEILLFDEILAVGDQHFQQKCFNKLEEIKNNNKTIVVVTHNLDSVVELCNRTIWLDKGAIRMDGPSKEVVTEYLKECE